MKTFTLYILFFFFQTNFYGADSWIKEKEVKESEKKNGETSISSATIIERDCFKNQFQEHWPIHPWGMKTLTKSGATMNLKGKGTKAPAGEKFAMDLPGQPPTQNKKSNTEDKPSISKGNEIYLSNDDSMSLSSPQRIINSISNFQPPEPWNLRPHEFLNYFSFKNSEIKKDQVFSVQADLYEDDSKTFSLSFAVDGKKITKKDRKRLVLNLVIDRSGSMSGENRMSYLKSGLIYMLEELKEGDLLNLVLFDHEVCVPLENFSYGRDDLSKIKSIIEKIEPRGSTDLHTGLLEGYKLAENYYKNNYNNRVLLVTDAVANTGITEGDLLGKIGKYYDSKKIALSGIGIGQSFNDSLFDKLTEEGRGAYLFLGGEFAAKKIFKDRFISLIENIARDVRFKVTLPASMKMAVFYGEEASENKEEVKPLHYFAGSSQLYLMDLKTSQLNKEEIIKFSAEFLDPETDKPLKQEFQFTIKDILRTNPENILKGKFLMAFTNFLAETLNDPVLKNNQKTGVERKNSFLPKERENFSQKCEKIKKSLKEISKPLKDEEINFVIDLADKYCSSK